MTPKTRRPKYKFEPRAKGTTPEQQAEWRERHASPITLDEHEGHLVAYLDAIRGEPVFDGGIYTRIARRLTRTGHPHFSKDYVRRGYREMIQRGLLLPDEELLRRLTVNPVRTLSGVAPVTVLTKPFVCPGRCIFCPDDVRMPKSYLSNEPGAMRALMLDFDPYRQVDERLRAMEKIGHKTDKVELLILGGTWSAYPHDYQEWFVHRMFDALNGSESTTLEEAHLLNETSTHRNTGLVVETRPDHITPAEVYRLRWLGVTRVQLGVQSLSDHVSSLNKRGETLADVKRAMRLLRGAGFKIAVHWMPNLLGATPASDLEEFRQFWQDPSLRSDEMKLYPTGLLRGTELYDYYLRGEYRPYGEPELIELLAECKKLVPEYCRLNRVMRDIPAPEIADGVTTSNLRQVIQRKLTDEDTPCRCIRCREVRREQVDPASITWNRLDYSTDHSLEVFLSAVTPEDKLAGFLRLSLPTSHGPIPEIHDHAIIRQVQVYGPALTLEDDSNGRAQHQGIGKRLIEQSKFIARQQGFARMAVIAAVGTREYYRRLGFQRGDLYMEIDL